jgi:LysR family hydrogen peroxide-inducible transcriptional activator
MNTTQLKYFVALADCQSFSKAAILCHTSQPNLSEQIQKLEKGIGKSLFDHNRRRIVPTEAGRILLEYARGILEQMAEAKLAIQGSDEIQGGKVSVGVLLTIAPFLVHVLNSFVEQQSRTQIFIHETTSLQMLPMIESGKLDLGIIRLPMRDNGFSAETLYSEEMLLALPLTHPLTHKQVIFKEDLVSEKFILLREDHCLGDPAFQLCRRNNFSPRIVFQNGQLGTVQSLVAAGSGISLVPQTAMSDAPVSIAYRKLENTPLIRSIALVTRNKRSLSPTAQEFCQHLRNAGRTFKLPVVKSQNENQPSEKRKMLNGGRALNSRIEEKGDSPMV